jgi:hypothetical protein
VGSLFAGRCFSDAADATATAWAEVAPAIDGNGLLHVVSFQANAPYLEIYDDTGLLVSSIAAPSFDLAPCNPVEYVTDGLVIGSAVAFVWISAAVVLVLRKAL